MVNSHKRAFILHDCVQLYSVHPYSCLCIAMCPWQHEFFKFFESSFLEAPQAVQFHAVATCYHDGMDDGDDSTFDMGLIYT